MVRRSFWSPSLQKYINVIKGGREGVESGHGGSFFLFWRNRGGEGEEDVVETKAAEEGEGSMAEKKKKKRWMEEG